MDNVSILQFSLSQIKSVLICSIRVSIKSFTFQQTDLIAQLYISVFDLRFWFSDSSKLAIDSVKFWPSDCFFSVTSSMKSSIKIPKDTFLLVVQLCKKKDFHLGFGLSQQRNWLKVLRNFNFLTHIKIQTCFSPKSKAWLLRKRLQSKSWPL